MPIIDLKDDRIDTIGGTDIDIAAGILAVGILRYRMKKNESICSIHNTSNNSINNLISARDQSQINGRLRQKTYRKDYPHVSKSQ